MHTLATRTSLLAILSMSAALGTCSDSGAGDVDDDVGMGPDYEIVTVLAKDAILAVDVPEFWTVEEADSRYDHDELVIRVALGGDARAYSLPFLSSHEIVNDTVGGHPIAVTW